MPGRQPDRRGVGGRPRQREQRVERRILRRHRRRRHLRIGQHDVLARPHRIEPRRLGRLRRRDEPVGPAHRTHVDVDEPEPHARHSATGPPSDDGKWPTRSRRCSTLLDDALANGGRSGPPRHLTAESRLPGRRMNLEAVATFARSLARSFVVTNRLSPSFKRCSQLAAVPAERCRRASRGGPAASRGRRTTVRSIRSGRSGGPTRSPSCGGPPVTPLAGARDRRPGPALCLPTPTGRGPSMFCVNGPAGDEPLELRAVGGPSPAPSLTESARVTPTSHLRRRVVERDRALPLNDGARVGADAPARARPHDQNRGCRNGRLPPSSRSWRRQGTPTCAGSPPELGKSASDPWPDQLVHFARRPRASYPATKRGS